jgi:hypothetical protein
MTTPQTQAASFRRLSFEELGGDDFERHFRCSKGILREATTPALSVPYSGEGTTLYQQIDRNDVFAAIRSRAILTKLIVLRYSIVELLKLFVSYVLDYSAIKQSIAVKFNHGAPPTPPETFNDADL